MMKLWKIKNHLYPLIKLLNLLKPNGKKSKCLTSSPLNQRPLRPCKKLMSLIIPLSEPPFII
jgi:hypothetical protein